MSFDFHDYTRELQEKYEYSAKRIDSLINEFKIGAVHLDEFLRRLEHINSNDLEANERFHDWQSGDDDEDNEDSDDWSEE